MVPGARELVLALRARGLALYLASGTDEEYEARLLDITSCFDGGVYERATTIRVLPRRASFSGSSPRPACAVTSFWASETAMWKSKT